MVLCDPSTACLRKWCVEWSHDAAVQTVAAACSHLLHGRQQLALNQRYKLTLPCLRSERACSALLLQHHHWPLLPWDCCCHQLAPFVTSCT